MMRCAVAAVAALFVGIVGLSANPAEARKIRVGNASPNAIVIEIASTTSGGYVTLQLGPQSGTTFTVPEWWGVGVMVHSPNKRDFRCPFQIGPTTRHEVLLESDLDVVCPDR
eukprot:TRINITY_DN59011_c0_g1_i10.p2 TRINITY_DN59011_c0_g1~~TRINITY_DN59011_c0_g1_i10.p2  ORF type:complete len:112 (-),score=10.71 TRINITY_DN59011_c0_g1_i10:414-749(-)